MTSAVIYIDTQGRIRRRPSKPSAFRRAAAAACGRTSHFVIKTLLPIVATLSALTLPISPADQTSATSPVKRNSLVVAVAKPPKIPGVVICGEEQPATDPKTFSYSVSQSYICPGLKADSELQTEEDRIAYAHRFVMAVITKGQTVTPAYRNFASYVAAAVVANFDAESGVKFNARGDWSRKHKEFRAHGLAQHHPEREGKLIATGFDFEKGTTAQLGANMFEMFNGALKNVGDTILAHPHESAQWYTKLVMEKFEGCANQKTQIKVRLGTLATVQHIIAKRGEPTEQELAEIRSSIAALEKARIQQIAADGKFHTADQFQAIVPIDTPRALIAMNNEGAGELPVPEMRYLRRRIRSNFRVPQRAHRTSRPAEKRRSLPMSAPMVATAVRSPAARKAPGRVAGLAVG